MTTAMDWAHQKLEIRDPSGATVGYLVPLGAASQPPENGAGDDRSAMQAELMKLRVELERAQRTVAELTAAKERLSKERGELEAERNAYLRTLHHMLRKDDLKKVPGVAETLDWAATLAGLEVKDLHDDPEVVHATLIALLKTREDRASISPETTSRLLGKVA